MRAFNGLRAIRGQVSASGCGCARLPANNRINLPQQRCRCGACITHAFSLVESHIKNRYDAQVVTRCGPRALVVIVNARLVAQRSHHALSAHIHVLHTQARVLTQRFRQQPQTQAAHAIATDIQQLQAAAHVWRSAGLWKQRACNQPRQQSRANVSDLVGAQIQCNDGAWCINHARRHRMACRATHRRIRATWDARQCVHDYRYIIIRQLCARQVQQAHIPKRVQVHARVMNGVRAVWRCARVRSRAVGAHRTAHTGRSVAVHVRAKQQRSHRDVGGRRTRGCGRDLHTDGRR